MGRSIEMVAFPLSRASAVTAQNRPDHNLAPSSLTGSLRHRLFRRPEATVDGQLHYFGSSISRCVAAFSTAVFENGNANV